MTPFDPWPKGRRAGDPPVGILEGGLDKDGPRHLWWCHLSLLCALLACLAASVGLLLCRSHGRQIVTSIELSPRFQLLTSLPGPQAGVFLLLFGAGLSYWVGPRPAGVWLARVTLLLSVLVLVSVVSATYWFLGLK